MRAQAEEESLPFAPTQLRRGTHHTHAVLTDLSCSAGAGLEAEFSSQRCVWCVFMFMHGLRAAPSLQVLAVRRGSREGREGEGSPCIPATGYIYHSSGTGKRALKARWSGDGNWLNGTARGNERGRIRETSGDDEQMAGIESSKTSTVVGPSVLRSLMFPTLICNCKHGMA